MESDPGHAGQRCASYCYGELIARHDEPETGRTWLEGHLLTCERGAMEWTRGRVIWLYGDGLDRLTGEQGAASWSASCFGYLNHQVVLT